MKKNMDKITLYKIQGRDIDWIRNLLERDRFEETEKAYHQSIVIFQKEKRRNKDYALPFLTNKVNIERFVYIVLIPDKRDSKSFYWFRRGSDKSAIDKYKNINFPLYYLANCSDYRHYKIVSKKIVEFSLFKGESRTTVMRDADTINVDNLINDLVLYKESVESVTLRVNEGSQVFEDLKLERSTEVSFENGITVPLNMSDETVLDKIYQICQNISKRQVGRKVNIFKKIRKSKTELDNTVELVNLFKILQKREMSMEFVNSPKDIEIGKNNYFGLFKKNDDMYYINVEQNVHKIEFDEEIENLATKCPNEIEKEVLRKLGVVEYVNEDDFIGKVKPVEEKDYIMHVFHRKHYHRTTRSKFELCDILLHDKIKNETFLIFVKFEFVSKSAEVFWQSSHVHKFIKDGGLMEDKLNEYYENAGFNYKGIDLRKARFINLILPRGENRNTDALNHVYNLFKGLEGRENFIIIIPETENLANKITKIINI